MRTWRISGASGDQRVEIGGASFLCCEVAVRTVYEDGREQTSEDGQITARSPDRPLRHTVTITLDALACRVARARGNVMQRTRGLIGAAVAVTGLLLAAAAPANASVKHATSRVVLADGRSYILHDSNPAQPRPLIIALHGLDGTGSTFESTTGLDPFADNHQAAVVYPDAATTASGHRAWNAGACCSGASADDVTFIDQVVADTETRTAIDPARVYVWGWSNGGMMAWRLECQQPGLFAAAGVVSGALVPGEQYDCANTVVHVRHLHGAQDTTVPPAGGYRAFCPCTFPAASLEPGSVGAGSVVSQRLDLPCGHTWPKTANACGFWADGDLWSFSTGSGA